MKSAQKGGRNSGRTKEIIQNFSDINHCIRFDSSRFNPLLLGTVTYTRRWNTFRGGTGDVIIMTVVYRDKDGTSINYSVDIRELGIIISHEKEYRVNGNSKELIIKLVDWIKNQQ
ncbi:hypothetical protein [Gorillibacterium massiliense]|uniref:hypothetical protein n=1 Tax=Gorillibacterium massiliense TaxID=1280390 RepID=UPI00138DFE9C|nr:hypothetical protein [Gorillibacterium massiliense]